MVEATVPSRDVPAGTPTLGVEEEFLLCDPVTKQPKFLNTEVAAAGRDLGVDLQLELTRCQVETATSVGNHIRDLQDQLRERRIAAADAAAHAGCQLLAVGTPFYDPPPHETTHTSRYQRMAGAFGALTAGVMCGCHVHVGVEDRKQAVRIINRLRPWLPTLLALTANSPISAGVDTGYASWRYILYGRWPSCGPPPYFESVNHYDTAIATMLEAGVILDPHMVYWDVRVSDHLPTVEIRISDVPATVDETITYATLVHALVVTVMKEIAAGCTAPIIDQEVLRAACWRAARDGLAGRALDMDSVRLVPTPQLVRRLVDYIAPMLAEFGELERVIASLEKVFDQGNGAMVQRRTLAQSGITDVIDECARRTAGGCGRQTDTALSPS
ncbi:glutamate--cysteine ligase [Rhodococcus sp. NPDC056743]|uniref:glutamate--cysteine ligase 2 n=1 Tax=Rhodococcus sp. NPDC056743 TaxID=3345934 RepID=UPI00366A90C2